MPTTAAVLHPGQMGAAVGAAVRLGGHRVLWCPAGRGAASAARAAAADLEPEEDLDSLLAAANVVLSVCPPAAAEPLAADVARRGFTGVYVDANAVAPQRARRIGQVITAAGARFVDGAIIGPPPTGGRTARLYLAGDADEVAPVVALFTGSAVTTELLPGGRQAASALKMAFASYQKATRSLAAVAHALADAHGVGPHLLVEAQRMAGSPLAEPAYLPGVAARAWRWAPEMREVADTMRHAGLPPELADAAAEVLSRWDGDRDDWDLSVAEVLQRLGVSGT